MRILYVLPESAATGGGGIATYHRHASRAMAEAGHDPYLFAWSLKPSAKQAPHDPSRCRIIKVTEAAVAEKFGVEPFNAALSFYLLPELLRAIADFQPDIIESSDFMAPMYAYLVHRRAGLLAKDLVRPVVLYNHGMNREVYRANADMPDRWQRQQLAAERTAVAWADRLLVPARAAMAKLNYQMGAAANSYLLPEPYFLTRRQTAVTEFADRYVHMGRVSFSKGIDHVAHFLNVIHPLVPIDEIKMIGRIEGTTFRTYSARDFFLNRLVPDLHRQVTFTGPIKPEAMRDALNPGGLGGFSLSFSKQETFNYAFLEMLEAGLFPFTCQGTAMAEFFPETQKRWLLPEDFNMSCAASLVADARRYGGEIMGEIADHAFRVADPASFVSNYERIVAPLSDVQPRKPRSYTAADVTILMATRNPSEAILETIRSLDEQTQSPHLLILSDGSDIEKSGATLAALENRNATTLIRAEANEGLCASRQKLIEACTTPLAIFLDDDDMLDADYVRKTLNVFNNNQIDADAVLTWRRNFGLSSELMINYNLEDYESLISNDYRMTALIRVDVLRSLGFTPSMRNGEADDWDFWLRFFQSGHKAAILPEPLFRYNLRNGSMSWPWSKGQTALTSEILARHSFALMRNGKLPEAYLLDLYSQMAQQAAQASSEKEQFRKLARRRPIAGTLAYFMFRMSRSVLKRAG